MACCSSRRSSARRSAKVLLSVVSMHQLSHGHFHASSDEPGRPLAAAALVVAGSSRGASRRSPEARPGGQERRLEPVSDCGVRSAEIPSSVNH